MPDADIIDWYYNPVGMRIDHLRVNPRVRAGILGMPRELWSARHPSGTIMGMGVGATESEAVAKLVANYPELRAAA